MPETAQRQDPFRAFRFEVTLDGMAVGGFSECTGLTLEIEVKDYAQGGLNDVYLKLPGRTKQANITLKRGVVTRDLWDWLYDLTQGKVKRRGGSIVVKDEAGREPVMEWRFREAFPVKWAGPDLNASQNTVAMESIELCHQGLERRR